ncbi:iron uptake porin [Leptothoe kymatousa]|uniref:Carbohydrate porin n=1 Tax=Leptothoe kymatousa TAU-MAC 1615 TaxID=2364775 RepID=A0ABS5Y0P5_9CYAN|nr:iron uptake porin [Leptothoe kymatousa]MBT9311176.1 carbohydrate porin [Leptothoe kymatousa TAU-MAC 1615]
MANLWKALMASPFVLGAALSNSAVAAETVSVDALSNSDSIQLAQVTSVSELSDVLPSDWAYTALQRLVEEYGCLEGYPDRSYRGNRAMTRYEFAAGLNACLDVIVQLIGPDGNSELETIKRLQEEFAAELATIRGRVDTLEADVAELEANQFSTTTKLKGQLDAHLVIPFDTDVQVDTDADGIADTDADEVTFEYRTRLNLDTSFTGEDRLRTRLQFGDSNNSATGIPGNLARDGGTGNNVVIDDVYYSFPVGSRVSGIIAANSIVSDDFVSSTIVPFDGPSVGDYGGPQFYDQLGIGGNSLGVGFNVALTENLIFDAGYATGAGQDASQGIFDEYEYIFQLNYLSDGIIDAAVTYMGGSSDALNDEDEIIAGLLSLDFGGFELAGYYADQDGDDSYQFGAALPNLLGDGVGIYYTQDFDDNEVIEGYMSAKINKYWTLTPSVIYGNPDGGDNDGLYGVVRSTFKF